MKFSRRDALAGASAMMAVGIVRFPAGAAEFKYRMPWSFSVDHHCTRHLMYAAEKISQESAGRLQIDVFPNNALGSSAEAFSQIRLGASHLAPVSDDRLAAVLPVANILQVPFAWKSLQQALGSLNSPLEKYRIEAIRKTDLYTFEKAWPLGMRQTINRIRPVNRLEDLKGLKVGTVAAAEFALYRALGAAPAPIVNNEIYTSLQTRVVDGIDLPLETMTAMKLYETAKYFSYTNHVFQNQTLVMNGDAWRALPKKLQEIVDRNFNVEALSWRSDILRDEMREAEKMKREGVSLNHPSIAIEQYREVVRASGLYAQIRDSYPSEAWRMLEAAVGRLA